MKEWWERPLIPYATKSLHKNILSHRRWVERKRKDFNHKERLEDERIRATLLFQKAYRNCLVILKNNRCQPDRETLFFSFEDSHRPLDPKILQDDLMQEEIDTSTHVALSIQLNDFIILTEHGISVHMPYYPIYAGEQPQNYLQDAKDVFSLVRKIQKVQPIKRGSHDG